MKELPSEAKDEKRVKDLLSRFEKSLFTWRARCVCKRTWVSLRVRQFLIYDHSIIVKKELFTSVPVFV